MKQLIKIFPLVLLVGLCVYVFTLPAPTVLVGSVDLADPGQETFLRQLELGNLYFEQGDFDQAEIQYQRAALAGQADIAEAARDNLVALQEAQTRPGHPILTSTWEIIDWIWSHFIALAAVGLGLYLLIVQPFKPLPVLILPFDGESSEFGNRFSMMVYDRLKFIKALGKEFQSPRVYENRQITAFGESGLPQTIAFPYVGLQSEVIESIGEVELGSVKIDLMTVLRNVYKWLGLYQYVVSGNVYQSEQNIELFLHVKKNWREERSWHLSVAVEDKNQTQAASILTKEVAYRLLHYINGEKSKTNSWLSLQHFYEGLQAYLDSQETSSLEKAQEARDDLLAALEDDPSWVDAKNLLGVIRLSLGEVWEARNSFDEAAQASTRINVRWLAEYNQAVAAYYGFAQGSERLAYRKFEALRQELDKWYRIKPDTRLLKALVYGGLANVSAQFAGHQKWALGEDDWLAKTNEYAVRTRKIISRLWRIDARMKTGIEAASWHAVAGANYLFGQSQEDEKEAVRYYLQALEDWEQVIAIDVRHLSAVGFKYLMLVLSGQMPVEEAVEGLASQSKNGIRARELTYVWFRLGLLAKVKSDFPTAIRAYDLAGDFPLALAESARLEIKYHQDYMKGLEKLYRSVEVNPQFLRGWEDIAWRTIKGIEADKLDKNEYLNRAQKAAEVAVEIATEEGQVLHSKHLLGISLFMQGECMEAVELLRPAAEANPDNRQYQSYLKKAQMCVERQGS